MCARRSDSSRDGRSGFIRVRTGSRFRFDISAGGDPRFEYFATGPSTIRIVDAGYNGDEFKFLVDGVPYFTSIPVFGPSDFLNTFSFDLAWADPHLSRGTAFVGPGLHLIEIEVVKSSFNTNVSGDAIAYIQANAVPEPGAFLLTGAGIAWLFGVYRAPPRGKLPSFSARTQCSVH